MFDLGDTVPLGIEVRDAADALTAASAVVLTITLPDGTSATPSVTTASTGVYTCLYVPTQAGRHLVRWTTTGPATAHTDTFDVAAAAPPLLVSLDEAKAHLGIRSTDTDQDDELRGMIEAVTAVVEGGDGNDFPGVGPVLRRTVTTTLRSHDGEYVLPYTNIISLTSGAYASDASAVTLTGFTFDQGILRAPYTSYLPTTDWTLTYVVGLPDLPANIRMGALELLKEMWRSQNSSDEPVPFLVPYRVQAWFGPHVQVLGFA